MDHVAHLVVGDWGSGIEQLVACLHVACMQWTAGDAQDLRFFKVPFFKSANFQKSSGRETYIFGGSKIIY
jgi:hypothetical protein